MQKIKKYVENFFQDKQKNTRYGLYASEMMTCKDAMEIDLFDTINTLFNYGYAKGYRAAVSEMKKGGETDCKQKIIKVVSGIEDAWILNVIYQFVIGMTKED